MCMMYIGTVSLLDAAEVEIEQQQEQIALLEDRTSILIDDMTRLEDELEVRYDRIEALESQVAVLIAIKGYREAVADNTPEEDMMLKKLAQAEAGGQGVIGKALVMLTVINRKEHTTKYPDTIEGVVFSGAYTVTAPGGGYWTCVPDAECDAALYLVKHGWTEQELLNFYEFNPALRAYYFTNQGFSYGDRLFQYKNHYFSGYEVTE